MIPRYGQNDGKKEFFNSLCRIKSPIYPLHLGGVWMVGVRGYIGLQIAADEILTLCITNFHKNTIHCRLIFLRLLYTVYIILLFVKGKMNNRVPPIPNEDILHLPPEQLAELSFRRLKESNTLGRAAKSALYRCKWESTGRNLI